MTTAISPAFVVILGLGTVFAGLIVIILLCSLMSFFVRLTENKDEQTDASVQPVAAAPVQNTTAIPDKPALIAAISAVVAEELGTDITNIRIHSIKRI